MLGPLRRGNERRVDDGLVARGAEDFIPFLNQSLHGVARVPLRLASQHLKDLLQASHVILRLANVLLERGLQRASMRRVGHLWQCLSQPLFGVIEILDLIEKQCFERIEIFAGK